MQPVQVRYFTLRLRTNGVCECKMDVKVYMDSYMASNESCFMVTWIILRNHLLDVGLTHNTRRPCTPNAHNRWFIWFYHVWGPALIEIHWHSICLRTQSHKASHYTWGSVTTLHDFEGVLGRPLDTFFWALTIPWSRLLACVWSGPHYVNGLLFPIPEFVTNFWSCLVTWKLRYEICIHHSKCHSSSPF